MTTREEARYGAFRSSLGLDRLLEGEVRLGEVWSTTEGVFWAERRPNEGGRSVLCHAAAGASETLTPAGRNVRTLVHEYGGAAWAVWRERIWFVDFDDQRIFTQTSGRDDLRPLTPPPTAARSVRFADLTPSPDGRRIFAVRERHGSAGVVNDLVEIDAAGGACRVVAQGADFYTAPRVSPDGARVAWICWNHPHMPWEGTELFVAALRPEGGIGSPRRVAGGPDESVLQPEFGADGALHFVSDRTGFWNLYREESGDSRPLCPMSAELGRPPWVFGSGNYAVFDDGRIACVWIEQGQEHFGVLEPGAPRPREIETGGSAFGRPVVDRSSREPSVVLVLGSWGGPAEVVRISLDTGTRRSLRPADATPLDTDDVSTPELLSFETGEGETAHALFYPPRNGNFRAPSGERPPLVTMSHGGPTGAAPRAFQLEVQILTSRGLAVVDVDYRGSTGYGRAYRARLDGEWGLVDVEDCVSAAQTLGRQDRVDADRLAIAGGSAGGFTTLCALTFHDVFRAGVSRYGIGDLESLVADTHKFESRYLDSLIGPYPEARELYRARSPIHFTERLSCPLLLLQGLEDAVVPPAQAEQMVAALERKGLPYAYVPFPGEQHGFRRAENQLRALQAELFFFGAVFGYAPADPIPRIEIRNLTPV